MRQFFITGVGTGVGKTYITRYLVHQLNAMGRRVSALKPVVSGYSDDDPDSDPALILRSQGQSPSAEAIATISPWRFAAPLSPHLAAKREGRSVDLADVVAFCRQPENPDFDLRLVEGVGGVMSPIEPNATCLDWIVELKDPVILVTGTYLGAISHTLTALSVLRTRGASIRGIVVSESAESAGIAETVESLYQFGGRDLPLMVLDRLPCDPGDRWRSGPPLANFCLSESEHV
ncbi:MAG: dethiobiotin synthase [Isosphaeraceae bacterium]